MEKPKKHIFVCSSSRMTGQMKGVCIQQDSASIINNFIEEVQERGLDGEIFISNTGCLAICDQGPVVIVYPDNVWYGKVTADDVEEIMDSHIEGGEPVARLVISK
jgi:(2Fe-2S) ferredoxin